MRLNPVISFAMVAIGLASLSCDVRGYVRIRRRLAEVARL